MPAIYYSIGELHHSSLEHHLEATHTEADILLNSSSDSDFEDEEQPKRKHVKRLKKEETLYDWMSKSPASSSAVQSPIKELPREQIVREQEIIGQENGMFNQFFLHPFNCFCP